jgi:flavodoxin/NAD-dependent dihydropyrimidine dehydrogenase PreA subunit
MKCIVIYFSQTGNTEKIAQAIFKGVRLIAGHCDILPIKEANPKRLYEYDLIGVGSPVQDQEPPNVTAFIHNLRFVGGKHAFSFCTHGTMGYVFNPHVVPQLRNKGLVVIGWNDWYGTSWGPTPLPTPYPTDGHPDQIDLDEAEKWGEEMVWRSQRIYAGEADLIPVGPKEFISPDMGDETILHRLHFQKIVKFVREKCTYPKCRLCMDNCPLDGIDLSLSRPVIAQPCMNCFFCEQICPTGALNVDEKDLDLLQQWHVNAIRKNGIPRLAEAEAQGRFRRLTPDERVSWDTPFYKVYNKHPRIIIGKGHYQD